MPVQLAPTAQLLVEGGDERILPDPRTGRNAYGCSVLPEPALLSFGSSTASTLSVGGYAAADALRARLQQSLAHQPLDMLYRQETARIGEELRHLLQLEPSLALHLAASGTDVHRLAARHVVAQGDALTPLCVIGVDTTETGRRVPEALASVATRQVTIALRAADGQPRTAAEIDADFAEAVTQARHAGQRVLLILTDVSKSGLIAPSPACALRLAQQHSRVPDAFHVLVDACQLRLAAATLRAYLAQGWMVALTGSKFMAGPMFSAALLLPQRRSECMLTCNEPAAVNLGLLLRWEAALVEMRAFCALNDARVSALLDALADCVRQRLANTPRLQALPTSPLERTGLPLAQARPALWDTRQTIFPFLLRHADGRCLNRAQTEAVYRHLQASPATPRCQLGQPVACGECEGQPLSALRLCASAAWVVEAAQNDAALQAALAKVGQALERVIATIDEVIRGTDGTG
ncbi:MAG: hypothetical protein KBD60_00865 [Sterolibacterium sp.]|jgi:hypothetical protein|nr:hypothetical protein [Sterolibacterium sp.]